MTTELRDLHLLRATGAPLIDDKGNIIVPCVALMETVIHAVNSDVPELVPLATLKEAAATWDGKPILLGHPVKDGRQIPATTPGVFENSGLGKVLNPRIKGTKFLVDACFDPKLVEAVGGTKFLENIKSGRDHIELSVGAYVHTEPTEGKFNGKAYKAIWKGAKGDHLAILPNSRGACSVAAGCGTHRAAEYFVADEEFRAASREEIAHMAQKMTDCPTCDGDGTVDGKTCPTCDGEGEVPMRSARDISQKERDKVPGKNFAGKGTSYPIEKPEDVKAAADSIGRAGADNYSPEQLKKNIIRIAKRMGPSFVAELPKSWRDELKAAEELVGLLGKRHSAKDTEIIQGVHDHAVALGASCDMGMRDMEGHVGPRYLSDSLKGDSLDSRMSAVANAVYDTYNKNLNTPSPTPMPYTSVQAIYDDHVIVRKENQLYSVDYDVADDGTVTLGDKMTEVKEAYVAAESKPDSIRVEGGRFLVYSDSGRVLGSHATRGEAIAQQQAIIKSLERQNGKCACGQHG